MVVDKTESRIRRMFGDIAPTYDRLNHLLSMSIDKWWRRVTVKRVPPQPGAGPILDLCTGTGDLALAYDKAAAGRSESSGPTFVTRCSRAGVTRERRRGSTIV